MAEPKPLIINAPRQGIAPSPHVGFGDMRNLDIFSIPGVVKLNNILEKESTTAVTATVKWVVRDPVTNSGQNFYAVDSAGDLYVSTDNGETFADLAAQPTTGGEGQGLAIWKDYLFCARETIIDTYGPLSGSPDWLEFKTDLTSDLNWHPMLVSKLDGKLYIGSGRYIATLEEKAGQNFADGTAATYTWSGGDSTNNALTLPEDYKIKCLVEQGNNLMIGTWVGVNIWDNKIADIFPWDGNSTTYGTPIQLNENGVNAMINIGGFLYILAGIDGDIYKSNGTQAWKIAQIPLTLSDISNKKYLEPYPGAIISYKGRLFFGMSSSATATRIVADGVGVYSLMEGPQGNIVNFEHAISTLTMGSANPTIIGALLSNTRDELLVGWRDNATYGIDMTTPASYLYGTSYTKAYFDSPLYQVGSHLNKRQFSQLEFVLAKELAASEGIQVKFKVNLTDSWTTVGTYTTANIGTGVTSYVDTEINIPACEMLQIRVELLGTATSTPEFKSLMLM